MVNLDASDASMGTIAGRPTDAPDEGLEAWKTLLAEALHP